MPPHFTVLYEINEFQCIIIAVLHYFVGWMGVKRVCRLLHVKKNYSFIHHLFIKKNYFLLKNIQKIINTQVKMHSENKYKAVSINFSTLNIFHGDRWSAGKFWCRCRNSSSILKKFRSTVK
jgi:hypothetical protein